VKRFRWLALGGLVAFAALAVAGGRMLAKELETRQIGLPLGTPAPDFALVDQRGDIVTLPSLLARGKLAVVFFRSADW
jgi:cytochrome oxidase Cu insertion factor (SCO1/SenC/PrrC family)